MLVSFVIILDNRLKRTNITKFVAKLNNREVQMVSGIASYLALSTVSQSHMQCRLASRRCSRAG